MAGIDIRVGPRKDHGFAGTVFEQLAAALSRVPLCRKWHLSGSAGSGHSIGDDRRRWPLLDQSNTALRMDAAGVSTDRRRP